MAVSSYFRQDSRLARMLSPLRNGFLAAVVLVSSSCETSTSYKIEQMSVKQGSEICAFTDLKGFKRGWMIKEVSGYEIKISPFLKSLSGVYDYDPPVTLEKGQTKEIAHPRAPDVKITLDSVNNERAELSISCVHPSVGSRK